MSQVQKYWNGDAIQVSGRPTSLLAMASEQNLQFSGKEIEDNLIKIIDNVK